MSDLEVSIGEIYKYYKSKLPPELKDRLSNFNVKDLVLLIDDGKKEIAIAYKKICELEELAPIKFDSIELPAYCKNGKNGKKDYEKYIERFISCEHHMQSLMAADVNNLGCAYAWSNQYELARKTFDKALHCVGKKTDFDTIENNLKLIPEIPQLPLKPFPSVEVEKGWGFKKLSAHIEELHKAAQDTNQDQVQLLIK